ncbi:hypothetical protein ACF1A5_11375 [Streptomyces sp. NPDC014864]|uniref:deoxynucleotide monophosphate kinase family protein n=1 Tax=Streptomyces sp. NPDC014864 TaxID=3364924 RepID=UPI0036FFC4C8
MRNLALIGKAQSGKDTAAQWLVENRAYTRMAFADPLKEMTLSMDPYVPTGYGVTVRLSRLLADVGWDYAKTTYPEVRRILQHTGQAVRELDEDFWTRALARKLERAVGPVVVSDVRYWNEAAMLRSHGFTLVRIVRPERPTTPAAAALHRSENDLNGYSEDVVVYNTGSVETLHQRIAAV